MPPGVPDPDAVLRGHRGEVQALDFDETERWLLSGDSLGEVRVWDLQDLRPTTIRRLHPLSGGILSLRLFRSAGRQLLGTQGRDGAVQLWCCAADNLQLSDEPVRSFVRDCYSFCRFDVLAVPGQPTAADIAAGSGGGSSGQALQQAEQEQADAFLEAVLADGKPGDGAADAFEAGTQLPRTGAPAQKEHSCCTAPSGTAADRGSSSAGGPPYSAAEMSAAIWAVHPCGDASAAHPPALLAIPGANERTAEVVCACCGRQVAQFLEGAAGRKLGMLMAVQLFCAPRTAGAAGAALSADGGAVTTAAPAAGGACAPDAPSQLPAPTVCLAAGYEDGSVVVWQVGAAPGAAPLAQRQLCTDPIMALAIDSSAAGGACGSAEQQVVVFKLDLTAGRLSVRHAIELRGKGRSGVGDVAVRPDRRLLATAGWDGRVRLYKYRSGRALAVLKYHSSPATGLRFAPRSMMLATAARDGTLALWPLYQPEDA